MGETTQNEVSPGRLLHEVKTSLTTINLINELINLQYGQGRLTQEKMAKAHQTIFQQLERLNKLIAHFD
jgi:nitrogen fixation/metabolism regulation signal transduction histidine kinase